MTVKAKGKFDLPKIVWNDDRFRSESAIICQYHNLLHGLESPERSYADALRPFLYADTPLPMRHIISPALWDHLSRPPRHDMMARTPNTFDAHRLIWLADHEGRQDAIVEALFRPYFTEGRDIGDRAVLVELAAEAGIDPARARVFIEGEEGAVDVSHEEATAHAQRVSGVPAFVVDGRELFSGAQRAELMASQLRAAAEGRADGSWEAIYLTLRAAFPEAHYHTCASVQGFETAGSILRADIAGRGVVETDLFVCADGAQSETRRRLLPDVTAHYAGYIAWRGTLDEAAAPAGQSFEQDQEAGWSGEYVRFPRHCGW